MMKINKIEIIIFILLFAFITFLSFNRHSKTKIFCYQSQIWADRAGYYVYLPATFIYGYHIENYPTDIDEKTGFGFKIDKKQNKMFTKYTSGVAILFLPFFLIAHLLAHIFDLDPSGFSKIYHNFTNFSAAFYLCLGLFFLMKFLENYCKKIIALISVFIIFITTNLFYYTVSDPFMSHVYSFFLFSVFLYLLKKIIENFSPSKIEFIFFAVTTALILLIRPVNGLFVLFAFLIDLKSVKELKKRILFFLKPQKLLVIFLCFIIVFTPQMIYWHFLSGKFLYYSYENEGFINWHNPKILEVLFSTNNGLLLYTPIFILFIVSSIFLIFKKYFIGWLSLIVFIILTYLCASWHAWDFGCSYGQRSYVEYLALFIIPTSILFNDLYSRHKKIVLYVCAFFILLTSYINIRIIYAYDTCFYGGVWDWKEYYNYFDKTKMFGFTTSEYTFFTDFENSKPIKFYKPNPSVQISSDAKSGKNVCKLNSNIIYSAGFNGKLNTIGHRPIKKVDIDFYIKTMAPDSIFLESSIEGSPQFEYYFSKNISEFTKPDTIWQYVKFSFDLPTNINQHKFLKIRFLNIGKRGESEIDDLQIKFSY